MPQTMRYTKTNDIIVTTSNTIAILLKQFNNTYSDNINSTSSTDNEISRVPKEVSNRLLLYRYCKQKIRQY